MLCLQLSLGGRWNVVVRAVPCGDVLREEERVLHRAGTAADGIKNRHAAQNESETWWH